MADDRLSIAVVYDDSVDRPGGVAQHIEMLRRGLRGRGHDVYLLVGDSRSDDPCCRSLSRNMRVRFNGNALTTPFAVSGQKLERALADISPDVLHVQLPYSPLLAGRLIARADQQTAVVGTSHVFSELGHVRLGARLASVFNRRSARRLDRVLAVSCVARDFAEKQTGLRVDAVVPNCIDVVAIRDACSGVARFGDPTVVFVGSLVPRKGVDRLLAAWPSVLRGEPYARLLVAGDGPQRRMLEAVTRRESIGDSVRFLGHLDERQKARLLAAAARRSSALTRASSSRRTWWRQCP